MDLVLGCMFEYSPFSLFIGKKVMHSMWSTNISRAGRREPGRGCHPANSTVGTVSWDDIKAVKMIFKNCLEIYKKKTTSVILDMLPQIQRP